MTESLIDTDILSFYFKGDNKVVGSVTEYLKSFPKLNISVITYFEITGGLIYKQAQKQLNDFEVFTANIILFIFQKRLQKFPPNYMAC